MVFTPCVRYLFFRAKSLPLKIGFFLPYYFLPLGLGLNSYALNLTPCFAECGQSPGNSRASLNRQKAYKRYSKTNMALCGCCAGTNINHSHKRYDSQCTYVSIVHEQISITLYKTNERGCCAMNQHSHTAGLQKSSGSALQGRSLIAGICKHSAHK